MFDRNDVPVAIGNTSPGTVHKNGVLASKAAVFPEVTLSHMTLGPTAMCWKRERSTAGMATLTFLLQGSLHVESSEGIVVTREPGVYLLPPGEGVVTYRTSGTVNELVGVSMSQRLFSSAVSMEQLAPNADQRYNKIDTAALRPLLSFVITMCNLHEPNGETAEVLADVVDEAARALLVLCFEQDTSRIPLILRVREYVATHFSDPELSVSDVAEYEGVSTRTLQLELQEHHTNFTTLVRNVRAHAAQKLEARQPGLTLNEVSALCGFGSVSSLRRALKLLEDDGADVSGNGDE